MGAFGRSQIEFVLTECRPVLPILASLDPLFSGPLNHLQRYPGLGLPSTETEMGRHGKGVAFPYIRYLKEKPSFRVEITRRMHVLVLADPVSGLVEPRFLARGTPSQVPAREATGISHSTVDLETTSCCAGPGSRKWRAKALETNKCGLEQVERVF